MFFGTLFVTIAPAPIMARASITSGLSTFPGVWCHLSQYTQYSRGFGGSSPTVAYATRLVFEGQDPPLLVNGHTALGSPHQTYTSMRWVLRLVVSFARQSKHSSMRGNHDDFSLSMFGSETHHGFRKDTFAITALSTVLRHLVRAIFLVHITPS